MFLLAGHLGIGVKRCFPDMVSRLDDIEHMLSTDKNPYHLEGNAALLHFELRK